MSKRYAIGVSLVIGCGAAEPFEPDEVVTGIYHLTVRTEVDTCEPRRAEGSAFVAAFHTEAALATFTYDEDLGGTSRQQYSLDAAQGYTERWPRLGDRLDPCGGTSPNSSYVSTFTLIAATRGYFTTQREETWTLAPGCSSLSTIASCHSIRAQRYELVETCPEPCVLLANGPQAERDGLVCACDAPTE